MYTDKKNCNILTAVMLRQGITNVVVCPGSRNAVLVHNFAECGMNLYQVTDERSAAFFAIGLIESKGEAVAVCCTSGSALLDMAPAIAEAYYRPLPLFVISADRPECWIGQMDGQTIRQTDALKGVVNSSVQLPEIKDDDDAWYCERLVNESIIKMRRLGGPVHINVPISEPLFNFTEQDLPMVKGVGYRFASEGVSQFTDLFDMVIVGQMNPDDEIRDYVRQMTQNGIVVLSEQLANLQGCGTITAFDRVLGGASEETLARLRPMSIAYVGGHIVSKALKNFIRRYPPRVFVRVTQSVNDLPDTFKCVSGFIESTAKDFLCSMSEFGGSFAFAQDWKDAVEALPAESYEPMSDFWITGKVADAISDGWHVHVANSSSVRSMQRVAPDITNNIFCNRGVNGIDGSVSTAVGYWASGKPTLLITGDLSFFYDCNALLCGAVQKRVTDAPLRIVLINNGGGAIFNGLKGLDASPYVKEYIAAVSNLNAEGIAKTAGMDYVAVNSEEELSDIFSELSSASVSGIKIIEFFTSNKL